MITIAQYGLLIILSVFLIFHFLVLCKRIPYNIVWGGRIKSDIEMYRFEAISILINCFFLFTILVQSSVLTVDFPKNLVSILLWLMTILFLLNTVGNIISKNKIEKRVFTPITIILTLFSLVLALTN